MKAIAQIAALAGVVGSIAYMIIWSIDFASVTALLASVGAFAATFFFVPYKAAGVSQEQSVGDGSTAYQAGRDIKISKRKG